MANPSELDALIAAASKGGVVTLDPPGKEFQGPLVIRRPVTINGQGGTIWAEKGPVVLVESVGVVLNELNVEVTGTEDKLSGEEACALVARSTAPTLARVAVRGHVAGIPGEEGEWRYPRIVRLNKVKAGTAHTFVLRLAIPVPCRIDSLVSGVTVAPATLPAGQVEVAIKLEAMSEGIRLRGLLRLTTGRLTRRIELSGHVAAAGTDVRTGVGDVIYQPADWTGAATPLSPEDLVSPPPAPVAKSPPPAPPPPPAAKSPPPPPPAKAPPPVAPPTIPVSPLGDPKPKSRYRSVKTTGGLFDSPPPEEADASAEQLPEAEEVPDSTPVSPPPPEENSTPGSDPLKKTGRRKINKLPDLFGEPPPAE